MKNQKPRCNDNIYHKVISGGTARCVAFTKQPFHQYNVVTQHVNRRKKRLVI